MSHLSAGHDAPATSVAASGAPAAQPAPPTSVADRPLRPRQLLLVGLWLGLVAGLLESLRNANHRFVRGGLIGNGPHGYWMAPLADAVVLLFVSLVLVGIARIGPRLLSGRRIVGCQLFLAVLMVLVSMRMLEQTMWLAVGLLAAGIAVRMLPPVWRRRESVVRRATWTLPLVLIGVAAIAAAVFTSERIEEARATAAQPPPPPGAANLLFITLDTVRAADLSLYGYSRETTPFLAELAERGTVFEWAFSPSPYTLPAHASMFTGRYPHDLSCDWSTPLDDRWPTLAEVLRDRGYRTGGFVANMVFCGYEFGLNRGFIHYEDYPLNGEQLLKSSSLVRMLTNGPESTGARLALPALRWLTGYRDYLARKSAAEVDRDFLAWLDAEGSPRRPFFAFLNYFDAHHPYLPPEGYETMFAPQYAGQRVHPERDAGFPDNAYELPQRAIQAEQDAYDGAIRYLDDSLRRLMGELERRGALKNTLVVITADHGEQFGEHGLVLHGNSLYRSCLHVPLLLYWPGEVPAGVRIDQAVTLRDLGATVLDLLGVGAEWPGHSLATLWREEVAVAHSPAAAHRAAAVHRAAARRAAVRQAAEHRDASAGSGEVEPTATSFATADDRASSAAPGSASLAPLARGAQAAKPGQAKAEAVAAGGPVARSAVLAEVTRLEGPAHYPVSRGDLWSLVRDGWQYIVCEQGDEELYHLADDPRSEQNRVSDAEARERLIRMRGELKRLLPERRTTSDRPAAE